MSPAKWNPGRKKLQLVTAVKVTEQASKFERLNYSTRSTGENITASFQLIAPRVSVVTQFSDMAGDRNLGNESYFILSTVS